jgi:ABC-type branched-subunit amino acid transport system ATPase component
MVSFGHAAFFGLGAYATGVLVSEGVPGAGVHLVATVALTAFAALVIGAISLRTRGVYFIMITLAFGQMLFYLANSIKGYGGDEGLNIRARSLALRPRPEGRDDLLLRRPRRARGDARGPRRVRALAFGAAVVAIRDDDVRAEALGFPTYRYRLAVFVAAGAIAGVAGALSVNQQGYVSPNLLHWTQSGTLMVMVILGGVASLWGGVARRRGARRPAGDALGVHPALGVLDRLGAARGGAVRAPRPRRLAARLAAPGRTPEHDRGAAARGAAALEALRRRSSRARASTCACQNGEVHALIGPNGAGKTTLVAQLAGPLRPDRGRIVFAGDGHHLAPAARARPARARAVVPDHSGCSGASRCAETWSSPSRRRSARPGRTQSSQHATVVPSEAKDLSRPRRDPFASLRMTREQISRRADDVLRRDRPRRQGRRAHRRPRPRRAARARGRPRPRRRAAARHARRADGRHGPRRIARMEALIARLRAHATVLLIEHDVDAVFRLADRVSVLVSGAIIASGAPDAVRRDAGVIEAYLGEA